MRIWPLQFLVIPRSLWCYNTIEPQKGMHCCQDCNSWVRSYTEHLEHVVKVAHTRLPSVGFRIWSRFSAVSLQVTFIINLVVGCHYFPPGPQLCSQPLRRLLPILLLGEQRHDVWEVCLRLLPDSVVAAIWTQAFCAWVPHANHSPNEPPCSIAALITCYRPGTMLCTTSFVVDALMTCYW